MPKTTLDLSTLSDISYGAHTVKVRAKADGYRDSEFSNEVSWTKAPAVVNFTLFYADGDTGSDIPTFIKVGGAPANADDYDYVTKGDGSYQYGSSKFYNKAGAVVTSPVSLTAQSVYVWGFQVLKNGNNTILYNNNKTYNTALQVSLSENDEIKVQCEYFYD